MNFFCKSVVSIVLSLLLAAQVKSETPIKASIKLTGNCLKGQTILVVDFAGMNISKTANDSSVTLSIEAGYPKAVQVRIGVKGFIMVFLDSSVMEIHLENPPLEMYDYAFITGSTAARLFRQFVSEFNPVGRKVDKLSIEQHRADSVDNLLSNIISAYLRASNSVHLNSVILMTAKRLQGDETLKSYFEILKAQYDNLSDFVYDYPVHAALIKETFATTAAVVDSTLTLSDINNKSFRCFDTTSEYVLFDFWATWCQSCLEAIPNLQTMQKNFNNLRIVGVALHSKDEKVRKVVERFSIPWNMAIIRQGALDLNIVSLLNINFYPTYVLCSRQGTVLLKQPGSTGLTQIESYLLDKQRSQ